MVKPYESIPINIIEFIQALNWLRSLAACLMSPERCEPASRSMAKAPL
jgi:hypothetical protein